MKALLVGTTWCLLAICCLAEETPSPADKAEAEAAPPAPIFQLIIRPSTAVRKPSATTNSSPVNASSAQGGGGGGGAVIGGGGGGVGGIMIGGGGGFGGAIGGGGGRVIAGMPPGGMRQTYGSSSSGATLSQLIADVYGVPAPRLLIDFEPPEERYDVTVTSQGGLKNQIDAIRRQAVEAAFGLTAKHEQHDLDAYVLTVKDKDAEGLRPTQAANNSGWQGGAGSRAGVNVDFKTIVQQLEPLLKQPVVDETGLNGRYDFELKWDQPAPENSNPDSLIKALRDQLGIEATLAKRPIDILVVTRQQPARGRLQFNAGGVGGGN
jgi:uncharacterized protein (TIGR03435 family)